MGYLIYGFVAIGLHILHSQTPTFLYSSLDEKSVDQLTCIFIYLQGRKQDHSAEGLPWW